METNPDTVTWLHNFPGVHGQKYAKLEYTINNPTPQHNLKNPEDCWCEPKRMIYKEGEGWKEVADDSADDSPDN